MLRLIRNDDRPSPLLEVEWEAVGRRVKLSPRELQIVQHVFADEKEQTVATRLGISTHTVHTHLKRLYQKLGVASRVELVMLIFREHASLGQPATLPAETTPIPAPRRVAA